jgi:hypothetical protein
VAACPSRLNRVHPVPSGGPGPRRGTGPPDGGSDRRVSCAQSLPAPAPADTSDLTVSAGSGW